VQILFSHLYLPIIFSILKAKEGERKEGNKEPGQGCGSSLSSHPSPPPLTCSKDDFSVNDPYGHYMGKGWGAQMDWKDKTLNAVTKTFFFLILKKTCHC